MTDDSNIIFTSSDGRVLKKEDLKQFTGQVKYTIPGDFEIPPEAHDLHQQARELGGGGQYAEAITVLVKAMEIAPDWPYPLYDLAFTHLLNGNPEDALSFYEQVDAMAPLGFFTTKTAIYSLRGELGGAFPKDIYLAYLQIEWTEDPAEKLKMARAITEAVPNFAPAWKELANMLTDQDERMKAIETGLLQNPDSDLRGMLMVNKALVLGTRGKREEAVEILGNLILDDNSPVEAREIAGLALASLPT